MKALAIVCVLAGAANAQTLPFDTKKVEALFEQGNRHYDLGEYDQAVTAFRQAYALVPDPTFLFDIAQSYRLGHRCREASAAYRAYLRNSSGDDRGKVEQLIRELAPCVKAEEEKLRRTLPPPALSARTKRLRWLGAGVAGAGALALGGGVVLSARAAAAAGDLERTCGGAQPTCTAEEAVAIDRRGRAAERHATWLYAAGGATAAIGATLVVYTLLRPEHVVIAPTRDALFVAAAGRF